MRRTWWIGTLLLVGCQRLSAGKTREVPLSPRDRSELQKVVVVVKDWSRFRISKNESGSLSIRIGVAGEPQDLRTWLLGCMLGRRPTSDENRRMHETVKDWIPAPVVEGIAASYIERRSSAKCLRYSEHATEIENAQDAKDKLHVRCRAALGADALLEVVVFGVGSYRHDTAISEVRILGSLTSAGEGRTLWQHTMSFGVDAGSYWAPRTEGVANFEELMRDGAGAFRRTAQDLLEACVGLVLAHMGLEPGKEK